jgi:hypothetical protein
MPAGSLQGTQTPAAEHTGVLPEQWVSLVHAKQRPPAPQCGLLPP